MKKLSPLVAALGLFCTVGCAPEAPAPAETPAATEAAPAGDAAATTEEKKDEAAATPAEKPATPEGGSTEAK